MTDLSEIISNNITLALDEDIGSGDITANLIPEDTILEVSLTCREHAVLCGSEWFSASFKRLDPDIEIHWKNRDGDLLQPDQTVCTLKGKGRAILTAERTALNFLQTLSATATVTHYYQGIVSSTGCRILDTRKTIPGLRAAQKYAVTCGGGMNHRKGLYDAYLIKENHLAASGSIQLAVRRARVMHPNALLIVEVEDLDQLQQAIDEKVDRALLDNFSIQELASAVKLNDGNVKLEASGNIDEKTLLEIANTGVDYISIGALTKHINAIDFSLRFTE